MNGTTSSQKETANMVRPLIESFLNQMTQDQWACLTIGNPDKHTKEFLAEISNRIIDIIVDSIVRKSQDKYLTSADVEATVGNSVPKTFAEVLGVSQEVSSVSSEKFNHLLVKEVVERVQRGKVVSIVLSSSGKNNGDPLRKSSSCKADLVLHASLMMKDLICKMCNIKNTEVAATEKEPQSCSLQTPGAEKKIKKHEPTPEKEHLTMDAEKKTLEERAPPAPRQKTMNKGLGSRIKSFFMRKMSKVTPVDDSVPEEQISEVTQLNYEVTLVEEFITEDSDDEELFPQQQESSEVTAAEVVKPEAADSILLSKEYEQEEDRRTYPVQLVGSLVKKARDNSKLRCSPSDYDAIGERLFIKIWTEVKGQHFATNPERTEKINKIS